VSIFSPVFFTCLYEIIALPLMAFLLSFLNKNLFEFMLVGLLAGLTSIITIFVYNRGNNSLKLKMMIGKSNKN
jgi:uncharacterized membrane protein